MTDVLVIRHGESQSNAGLPTQFSAQVNLTAGGRKQAEQVAYYLSKASLIPDLIVTSPYERTYLTAFPLKYFLLREYKLKPLEEQWLVQEFTYLSMWHQELSTVEDRRQTVEAYWQCARPKYVDGPSSESFEQFIDRVRQFKAHLESTQHSTIAVFSHEQFISAFLWLLEKGKVTPTSEEMREFRKYLLYNHIPNGAIVHAKFHEGYPWSSELITHHLSGIEEKEPAMAN